MSEYSPLQSESTATRMPPNYPPPAWPPTGAVPSVGVKPAAPWVLAGISVICCWPAAIVALVLSSKVEPAWNRGDVAGAQQAAHRAKVWALVAIGIGALFFVLILAAASSSSGSAGSDGALAALATR